ncbi:AAA family ATPase [Pseudothauera rhizosphaerae]|uniref:ATP-binding protein n=1 Tax=Pseudothauera rhizosphaerae TaxID=2565932 RepID=A0A4S4AMT6_9RHOO|nr:ATP-binding protein [Pseudothauera rhizosphaerae]THF60942.1 ATP-binding protein [Pseudothauera rhizosphaerae]
MTQTAQIHNLELVRIAVERLTIRTAGLPGLAALYGPAGYGKTTAANAVANETRAYFVQMRSAWTRKTLLEKVLIEMSIKPHGTIPAMLDQACTQLAASGRMLIIDEFDYCVRSDSMVELVRDLHEGGGAAPILLLGEELLPQKLKKWERFHSRVLSWIPAQPVSLTDAAALVPIYCPDVAVRGDLLERLVKLSGGSVRRVAVNLAAIAEAAAVEGWGAVDLGTWGDRPLYTGDAPRRGV